MNVGRCRVYTFPTINPRNDWDVLLGTLEKIIVLGGRISECLCRPIEIVVLELLNRL